jgi:hypothetical protein
MPAPLAFLVRASPWSRSPLEDMAEVGGVSCTAWTFDGG